MEWQEFRDGSRQLTTPCKCPLGCHERGFFGFYLIKSATWFYNRWKWLAWRYRHRFWKPQFKRWLAKRLDRSGEYCWADLALWPDKDYNIDPLRQLFGRGETCRMESKTSEAGSCYCGKFWLGANTNSRKETDEKVVEVLRHGRPIASVERAWQAPAKNEVEEIKEFPKVVE